MKGQGRAGWWTSRHARLADVDAEVQSHLDMDIADRVARGEAPDDAARHAMAEFGSLAHAREHASDAWSTEWMHQLLQDVRYALRALTRAPGFAVVAVLTLALGIGANTAIFSVVKTVLLTALPYPAPHELTLISSQFANNHLDHFPLDAGEFIEFRERTRAFKDVGAYATSAVNVGTDEAPRRVTAGLVSPSLFSALGVSPADGRIFTEDESRPTGPLVVILSHELWETAFGRRPVVNTQILVDGVSRTVVGIMPAGFDVHDQGIRIWLPLRLDPAQVPQYRGGHYLFLIARRKNGVTPEAAHAELEDMLGKWTTLDGGLQSTTPGTPGFVHVPNATTHRLRFDDLQADTFGSVSRALWVLQGAVVFVLIIACANLANLLLMRAEARHKELVVRAALGASRGRLVRQFLAESMVLSLAGAALGVVLARVGLRVLMVSGAAGLPRNVSVALDPWVLAFTLGIALVAGVIFGLAPLLHLGASHAGLALRDAGSRTTASAGRQRLRRSLVVSEFALAVMLAIGAGLMVRSVWNLVGVDTGFDRAHLRTFSLALPPRVYTDSNRRVAFYDNLLTKLAAAPGITSVAAMTGLPPQRPINANSTFLEGYVPPPGAPPLLIDYYQTTTPDYFATMRVPIVSGRSFGNGDGLMSPPVVIINESLAKMYYAGQDPIGRRVRIGLKSFFTIVGVAKDVKQGGLDSRVGTELYFVYEQTPTNAFGFTPTNMNIVVRTALPPAALASIVRQATQALDPSLPVFGERSMDDVIADSIARPRLIAQLLAVFAMLALALAAIGTYGVLAYSIMERRREIGIRMALGASARGVLTMILGQGLALAGTGVVIGFGGAALLTRLTSSLLYGVAPLDPVTFLVVGGLMVAVAAVATIVPARRATRVDPQTALRSD